MTDIELTTRKGTTSPLADIPPVVNSLATADADTAQSSHTSTQAAISNDMEEYNRSQALTLPPMDKGQHAWYALNLQPHRIAVSQSSRMFVLCSFILESMVWGFSFSYVTP